METLRVWGLSSQRPYTPPEHTASHGGPWLWKQKKTTPSEIMLSFLSLAICEEAVGAGLVVGQSWFKCHLGTFSQCQQNLTPHRKEMVRSALSQLKTRVG